MNINCAALEYNYFIGDIVDMHGEEEMIVVEISSVNYIQGDSDLNQVDQIMYGLVPVSNPEEDVAFYNGGELGKIVAKGRC